MEKNKYEESMEALERINELSHKKSLERTKKSIEELKETLKVLEGYTSTNINGSAADFGESIIEDNYEKKIMELRGSEENKIIASAASKFAQDILDENLQGNSQRRK